MTAEKRLLLCDHPSSGACGCREAAAEAIESRYPAGPSGRHGDSVLGAAGAWACVAIVVLLMLTLAIRGLWLWLS